MGLVSPGGVHSHQDHAVALAKILASARIPTVVHAFTDGRDTPPQSAADDLDALARALPREVPIATVSGRYYAMDRDARWERVTKAYNVIMDAQGHSFPNAQACIADAYAQRQFDEFIVPAAIGNYRGVKSGDGVLCFNFRSDRVREILGVILDPPEGSGFARRSAVQIAAAAGMTQYSEELDQVMQAIFPPQTFPNILGEVAAAAGRTQLRMAETEKYPHVTYFLNGGREEPYEGEARIMVPSPKVATYDMQPEMSAPELTDKAVLAIKSGQFDLIVLNFANPDMVGHTGSLPAAIKAVETVDAGLGRIAEQVEKQGGALLGHRGSRQLRNDARSGHRRAAHRAHHQSGAGAADGRRRGRVARRPPRRHRADFARIDGIAAAARDDRRVAGHQETGIERLRSNERCDAHGAPAELDQASHVAEAEHVHH